MSPAFATSIILKLSTTDNTELTQAGIGHPFLLHVIIEGASNTAQYPIIKNVDSFHVRRNGFQMNMVNGATSTTYSYLVRIDEPGTFTLGPAQITESNGPLESEPIRILVGSEQKAVESRKNKPTANKSNILRLTCDKETVHVGECIHCSLTFFTSDPLVSLHSLNEPDQQSLTGFTIKNKSEPITGTKMLNGIEHRFAQWNWDLYATRPGTLVLPAYAVDYNTQTNNTMFGFLFAANSVKRVYSNTIPLNVHPLPAHRNKPALIGFIDQFTAKIEPAHAHVGQGMALTLAITGQGDFQSCGMLELKGLPADLKWYDSKHHREPVPSNSALSTHVMEYVIQALNPGTYTLAPQEIFYFDTRERTFKTHKTNAITIQIMPAPASQKNVPEACPQEISTSGAIEEQIIKPLAQKGPWATEPLHHVPWKLFWSLMALLAVVWLLLTLITTNQYWLYKKVATLLPSNSIYSKARKQLQKAHELGNYTAFYTIFINLLASHFRLDGASLSPENIEQTLINAGLTNKAVQDWKLFYSQIAESGFYKQSQNPYFYTHLYEQSLYWVSVIETVPRGNRS